MQPNRPSMTGPVVVLALCLLAMALAIFRPGYLNNTYYLSGLVFLHILAACIWKFRERFFPLVMIIFLWAGMALPFSAVWTSGRWLVLAVGAAAGFFIYLRDRARRFGSIHLLAGFCILAAIVSAEVSSYPQEALLKAVSLLLLFLYAACGARLAVIGREDEFFSGLLLGCEWLVYVTGVAYFVLRLAPFDNPNSLGAVMGVVALPLMLWGILTAQNVSLRRRRTFAFSVAMALLLFSLARAGIVAGVVACVLLCLTLRRFALLLKGIAMAAVLASALAFVVHPQTEQSASVTSVFLYKGHREQGVLGSRRTPWQRTMRAIQQHPWFGSGFGTSSTRSQALPSMAGYQSAPQTIREHGNSYLAITEWVGLLGVLPFAMLLTLLVAKICGVLRWVRRTGKACHVALPIVLVLMGGLVHAAFEDWLFAVGYYLCVFFWVFAFVLMELLPDNMADAPSIPVWRPDRFAVNFRVASAVRQ